MVSIIIPYYNNEKTILETLQSVFDQTYSNTEVILVNDGSINDIYHIVKPYIESKKLIYLSQENKGVSTARNYGAATAKGKYLLFLDADDLIDKDYVSKCVAVFQKDSEVKIVYCDALIFGRENKKWKLNEYQTFRDFLASNCIFVSALLKKEDFDDVKGFDTSLDYYEDWELWISILKNGGKVHKLREVLFFYRKNENESSSTDKADLDHKNEIRAKNRLKIYLKHYELYEKEFTNFEKIFLTYFREIKKKEKMWYRNIFKNRYKRD